MRYQPRAILKKRGIRPLKRLGQSFLEDKNIIKKIVAIADLCNDDVVVEIGAGLGIMTDFIANAARQVLALEVDPYMISILEETLGGRSNIKIIQTDVLKYDFSSVSMDCPSQKLKIIGNVPYNISSQILFHVLNFRRCIDSMVVMFQKEMADRIMAGPGTKAYGVPTVFTHMYADVSQELIIPPTCFYPAPKVNSSVLKFIIRKKPLYDLADDDLFGKVVKVAFSQRRKTLSNNLRNSILLDHSEIKTGQLLEKVEIEGRRRAETLSVEEFGKLSNGLAAMKHF